MVHLNFFSFIFIYIYRICTLSKVDQAPSVIRKPFGVYWLNWVEMFLFFGQIRYATVTRWWAKIWKIWRQVLVDFGLADDFFVEAPKLKVSLTDFQGFCHRWSVRRWSPDIRPTVWRNLHHDIDRRSPDHRESIGRRSPDDWSVTFYQNPSPDRRRMSAVIRPIIVRLKADHKLLFVLYWLQCIFPYHLWY